MPTDVIDLTASDDGSEGEDSQPNLDQEDGTEDGTGSEGGPEGHDEHLELAMDNHTRAQLQTAIATVPIGRLREVVARLVLTVPTIEAALAQELLGVAPGTANVVPRYTLCSHCGREFDAGAQRRAGECVWHPGEFLLRACCDGVVS